MVKTVGTTGTFSTPQLWEDGAPTALTTAEKSACTTFAVATFVQGEALTFVGSGATGTMLDTDSTGVGTGTYMTYGITAGNPAAADVITGASTATCILTSGTADHVGVIWEGQCQNQEFTSAVAVVVFAGSTTSATTYKHITTVAGASFRDHANVQTNPLRYDAAMGCGFRGTGGAQNTLNQTENFCRASNLQVQATGSNGRGASVNAAASYLDWSLCETTTGTAGETIRASSSCFVRNCVAILRVSGAAKIVGTSTGTPQFYNCTFVASDDLATAPVTVIESGASGSVTLRNCGGFAGDSTKAFFTGSATPTYTSCYTDTASPPAGVTQTTYSSEFQNVNDATRDFRLKAGAAQIDTGTTDSTHAAIDIAGTARPNGTAYDVGAWELVAAGAGIMVEWRGQWL